MSKGIVHLQRELEIGKTMETIKEILTSFSAKVKSFVLLLSSIFSILNPKASFCILKIFVDLSQQ